MRRAFNDALLSVGAIAVVLLVLVAIDERVRGALSMRFVSHPAQSLAAAGNSAQTLTAVITQAARDQGLAHAPLLVFVLAASVLVVFMLRT